MMVMKWKRLREGAQAPQRQTEGSAGFDLQACIEAPVTLAPGGSYAFPTGIAAEIPQGCAGLIFTRSGLGFKKGVAVRNGVGVIDSDYRGEIGVAVVNLSGERAVIAKGERIAQLAVVPVARAEIEQAQTLADSERGAGGFGSTGRF